MFLTGQRCTKCAVEKRKETNLKLYGNEVAINSDILKEIWVKKVKNRTDKEKEEIQDKRKITTLEKYGCEHTLQSKKVRDKGKETNLLRYGYEHHIQNVEMFNKLQIKSKKYKKYTLPSGDVINIQGYENYALDILLKEYTEDEIVNSRNKIPTIDYEYKMLNKRYFPDIYIPKENKIIEVKSTWTYKKELVKNLLKAIYTRKAGYLYEVWIIDKQELINIL
jgi:hypothetical protein